MKRSIIAAFVIGLVLSPSVFAQHWTDEEQEIIDLNQSCWDAWASEDLDAVDQTCNDHPDGRGWFTADSVPEIGWTSKNRERYTAAFHPRQSWLYWEIRPLSVRIFNDTALIHYWATRTFEDSQGKITTKTQKSLNIWQRIDGRWSWIGGMAAPEGE